MVHEERFASRSGDLSAQSGERVAVVVGVAAVLVDSEELGERPDGFVSDAAFGFALDAGGGERTRASMQTRRSQVLLTTLTNGHSPTRSHAARRALSEACVDGPAMAA